MVDGGVSGASPPQDHLTNGFQIDNSLSHMNGVAESQAQGDASNDDSISTRLPPSVIECILRHADLQAFLNLSILDRRWNALSNKRSLYLYHLARCPSYTSDNLDAFKPLLTRDLSFLKQELGREASKLPTAIAEDSAEAEVQDETEQEVKYTHTIWRLVAPSTTASTIAPDGESFSFYFSSNGRYLVASSSSRIFVLNVTGTVPIIDRELKVRRRPITCIISDDGEVLVVLSSDWRIDSYRLKQNENIERLKLIYLEGITTALAMSPDCTLLAAAHENCLEFVSLSDDIPSSRRRKIACETAQHLSFSKTGMALLGTSTDVRKSATTIINAPEETSMDGMGEYMQTQRQDQIWLAQLLFPNTFQDCSFAAFLPESDLGQAPTLFGYDAPAECFGLLDLNQLTFNGPTVDLPLGNPGEMIRYWSMPKVKGSGHQVAVGCPGSVQVYDIPSAPTEPQYDATLPRRDISVDEDVSSVTWVDVSQGPENSPSSRLVGVLPTKRLDDLPAEDTLDSGRLVILDFGDTIAPQDVERKEFQLSGAGLEDLDLVAPDQYESELAEEGFQLAQRAASIKPRLALGRSVTSARHSSRPRRNLEPARQPLETSEQEQMPPVDEPYSHTQPRSAQTLQRAATAGAGTRRYHNAPSGALVFRRADRSEIPDESDADNWVPPPPPYQRSPDDDVPAHLRGAVQPQNNQDTRPESRGTFDTITDEQLLQRPSPPGSRGLPHRSTSVRRSFTDPLSDHSPNTEASPGPNEIRAPETHIIERPIILSRGPPSPDILNPSSRARNRHSLQPGLLGSMNNSHGRHRKSMSMAESEILGSSEASPIPDPKFQRSLSQILPTGPVVLPPEPPPVLPSAAQMASLNRRHTLDLTGSPMRIGASTPRAAAGARRSLVGPREGYQRMDLPPPVQNISIQPGDPQSSKVSSSPSESSIPPLPSQSSTYPPVSPTREPVPPQPTQREEAPLEEPLQDILPTTPLQEQTLPSPPPQQASIPPPVPQQQGPPLLPLQQGLMPQFLHENHAPPVLPMPQFSTPGGASNAPPGIVKEVTPQESTPTSNPPHVPSYLLESANIHLNGLQANQQPSSTSRLAVERAPPPQQRQADANGGPKALGQARSMSSLLAISQNQSRGHSRQGEETSGNGYGVPRIESSHLDNDDSLKNQHEPTRRKSVLFGAKKTVTRVDGASSRSANGDGKLRKSKRGTKCNVM